MITLLFFSCHLSPLSQSLLMSWSWCPLDPPAPATQRTWRNTYLKTSHLYPCCHAWLNTTYRAQVDIWFVVKRLTSLEAHANFSEIMKGTPSIAVNWKKTITYVSPLLMATLHFFFKRVTWISCYIEKRCCDSSLNTIWQIRIMMRGYYESWFFQPSQACWWDFRGDDYRVHG